MNNYCLSCCSTADLSREHFQRRDIRFVCFHFDLDGEEYLDDCGVSMPPDVMYTRMQEGASTRTSQVSVGEYLAHFKEILEEGMDILHVSLSTGISGTYNSACVARDELQAEYPNRKIYVVDSLGASSGYGLLMNTLADFRDQGWDLEKLHTWTEKNKKRLQHWFFSSDLSFYIRGGRISKTAGALGTIFNICPLLNMDHEGKLIPREKIRTKKKVIQRIVEKMQENAENGLDYSGKCYISQSMCIEDAKEVARLVEESFQKLNGSVEINPIGATIGCHTGPGTVALFFWGQERIN